MNLLTFHDKITFYEKEENSVNPSRFFSETCTLFNVLNGTFPDEDIINIRVTQKEQPTFAVALANENIAECAEENLHGQIVPGAYKPLYKLDVTRNANTLFFRMNEM